MMLLNFTLFYFTLLSNSNSNFNSISNSIFTLVSLILSTSYFSVLHSPWWFNVFCSIRKKKNLFSQKENSPSSSLCVVGYHWCDVKLILKTKKNLIKNALTDYRKLRDWERLYPNYERKKKTNGGRKKWNQWL